MQRRNFLRLAAALPLTALTGCGSGWNLGFGPLRGGGGGGSDVTLTNRSVPVTLPAGLSLPTGELAVETIYKSAALDASGAFLATVPAGDQPALAFLRHVPSDRVVLMGFTHDGTRGVSALGSAAAILYYALGVSALPAIGQTQALALIEAHPATASLADVIARRVAASPFALTSEDAEIGPAVLAARSAIQGGASRAVKLSTRQTRAELAPLLTVTPNEQSGANVEQGDDGQSVRFVNTKRRPLTVHTYRVAEDTGTGKKDLPKAVEVGSPIDVPVVQSIVGAIGDLARLNLAVPWAPVTSAPVPLALTSGSVRTYFQSVVLMASGKTESEGEPSFFTDVRYSGEVARWRLDRRVLNTHAWIGGILGDIVASIVGVAAVGIGTAKITAALAEMSAIEAATGKLFLEEVALGRFGYAMQTTLETAGRSDLLGATMRKTLVSLVENGEVKVGQALAQQAEAAAFRGIGGMLLRVLAGAGLVALLLDIGSTYVDILSSSKAEKWDATLFKPTLKLSPTTAKIGAGGRVTLTATVPGAEGQKIIYAWSKSGGVGATLSGTEPGKVGDSFETASGSVDLVTTRSDQGAITVNVVAYVEIDGKRSEVGRSAATITVDQTQIVVAGRFKVLGWIIPVEGSYDLQIVSCYLISPIVEGGKSYSLRGFGASEKFTRTFTAADVANAVLWDGVSHPDGYSKLQRSTLERLLQVGAVGSSKGGILNSSQAPLRAMRVGLREWKWR